MTLLPTKLQPYAKSVIPFIATLIAIGVQWAATGAYDKAELATTITGLGTTLLAFLFPNVPPAAHDEGADDAQRTGGVA